MGCGSKIGGALGAAAPFIPGVGGLAAAVGGSLIGANSGRGGYSSGASVPNIPTSVIDPIYQNINQYYTPTASPITSGQNQDLINKIMESLNYRPPQQIQLPEYKTPTAGQNIYEGIIGGTIANEVPELRGAGATAEQILNQRLQAGGGIGSDVMASAKEQLNASLARSREQGSQAVMEELSRRNLAGPGSEPGRMLSDLEKDLQLQAGNQMLDWDRWMTGLNEQASQYNIGQGLQYGMNDRDLRARIADLNLARQLEIAGAMRGEQSLVQQLNNPQQLAEAQYQREYDRAETERVSSQAMNVYDYFTKMDQAGRQNAVATMIDVLGLYLGQGARGAQQQLQEWASSEEFSRMDDQTWAAAMTQLGRTIGMGLNRNTSPAPASTARLQPGTNYSNFGADYPNLSVPMLGE